MFQVTWPCRYNYSEQLTKSASSEPRGQWPWNLVYSIGYYQYFHLMTLGWPWPFLWQGHICFRMLLHGWKLIQHWMLTSFQVCSNSAYPQHSGERYRTCDPLVFRLVLRAAYWIWLYTCTSSWSLLIFVLYFFLLIFKTDNNLKNIMANCHFLHNMSIFLHYQILFSCAHARVLVLEYKSAFPCYTCICWYFFQKLVHS